MKRSTTLPSGVILALAIGLMCLLPACGVLGGNGDDDKKFPEPPDRPKSTHVVSAGSSQGAAPVLVSPAHRG